MPKKARKFLEEFRDFATRGNAMDLAVGVIIGAAFTTIVQSLVTDIITPLLGLFGKVDFSTLAVDIPSLFGSPISLKYGSFLTSVINFVIIAFVIFLLVKVIGKLRDLKPKTEETPKDEKPDPQVALLIEIRDLLQKQAAPRE